jgi:predicted ABC-type ATPase
MKSAVAYVIAGPNGAGKTTFAMEFLPRIAQCRIFVNADLIARGLSPLDADSAAIQAGRLFLEQLRFRAEQGESFAFETTLSGLAYASLFKELRDHAFEIHLYYLWIPTIDLALQRIRERVSRGGHNIPAETVRRRYFRGVKNLFSRYLAFTNYAAIFDNSSIEPKLVFECSPAEKHIIDSAKYEKILEMAGMCK